MKHAKKLASLLLALVMVLGLATTAFAAGTDGSISITNPVEGETYNAYLMFELESFGDNAYSYKITEDWKAFVETGYGKDVFAVDDQGYVTLKEDVTIANDSEAAAALAKAAIAYAESNGLTPAATLTKDNPTVSGLTLGYYVIDSSLGTLCSLTTTAKEAQITEKNEKPGNEKKVEEDFTGTYDKTNDADIGQTVNFQSTVTIPAGSENVTFHDTMDSGLTPDKTNIVVYTDEAMTTELDSNSYSVISDPAGNHCTFEITFTKAYLDSLTDTATVYVKYSATVNEGAVVAGEGNKNESKLTYGEEGTTETVPSETKTYTWSMDVYKYTTDGTNEKALAGAEFTLSKNEDGSEPIALIQDGTTYRLAKAGETGTTTITTTDTGKFTIEGLDADTYYLTETNSPAGYNKLAGPIKVVISAASEENPGTVTYYSHSGNADNPYDDSTGSTGEVKVLNQSGTELPSTGGIGTTIFYVGGGVLVLAAVVLLVTKKRMNAAK